MNLNFCRWKCNKMGRNHPQKIIHTKYDQWILIMDDSIYYGNGSAPCSNVEIEPVPELFENPPKGWSRCENALYFDDGNAEDLLWRVKLKGGEYACPFLAEHMMYDIQHEKRLEDWKKKEQKRLALIEDRLKKHNG